ncbi:hypothetical protein V6N13_141188 [Hibiscus sabdariffa]
MNRPTRAGEDQPKERSLQTGQNCSVVVKAKLNEVEVDGSSNASITPPVESGLSTAELKDAKPSSNVSPPALATEEPISEFLNQVSSLVKLVDSRDIVELQLKQLDCELIIRKNVALPQPPSVAPVSMMQASSLPPVGPPTQTAPAPAAATPAPSPAAPKSAKSLLPPLKCPMAGTFYRSPAPGEPPFVKVGDKVQKGQVICIIEAMKLMNEIECRALTEAEWKEKIHVVKADQSGTIVEILAEDGKAVSVDTGITDFSVDHETNRFQVNLTQPCNSDSEIQFHYDFNITGILSFGKIANLSGVSQQELFLWFPVIGIRVDDPASGLINFDVGVVDKQFSLSLFENPLDCTAVDPNDSSSNYQTPFMLHGAESAEEQELRAIS